MYQWNESTPEPEPALRKLADQICDICQDAIQYYAECPMLDSELAIPKVVELLASSGTYNPKPGPPPGGTWLAWVFCRGKWYPWCLAVRLTSQFDFSRKDNWDAIKWHIVLEKPTAEPSDA